MNPIKEGTQPAVLRLEVMRSPIIENVFIAQVNHSPPQCKKVSNLGSRIEILKKDSWCFLCLKKGHISKHFLSKYECRKCNGRHNISICSKSKNDFTKDDSKKHDLKNDDPNSYQSSSNQVIAHVGVLKELRNHIGKLFFCPPQK